MNKSKIIKLDIEKIKNMIKLSSNNNIKIFEKKNNNIKFRNIRSINGDINKIKKNKVKNTMKQIQKSDGKYETIKFLNELLLKDLKEIDSLQENISSIENKDIKKFSFNNITKYIDFNISSSEETFIETFSN